MNVNGALLKRKAQSENSDIPVKRIQQSENTQSISKKFRRDGDSDECTFSGLITHEAKAGIIERIYMRNFMCHSSMEVLLNPRINFVVGRNGSGKSAILTAVVVGLGGKASDTNRGNALKEFVKKGTSTATIEITLRNTGYVSYKREEYGDRIIVTRSISNATGQGCYKIKSEKGVVVSSRKEELDRIVSAFNIQVENPISMLNQDTARTFLNSRDPRVKYKLFMKATQLEQIQRSHAESMSYQQKASTILNSRKKALEVAKKEVTELECKWKMVQSLSDYRTRSRELENELYWAVAASEEKSAEKLEQEVESQRAQYSKLQHSVDKETEQEQMLKHLLKEVHQQIDKKKCRLAECEAEYKGHREEVRRRRENYMQKVKESRTLQQKIHRVKTNINELHQEIDKIRNSGPDHAARQQRIRLEIEQLENKLADVQDTLKTNKHHYSQLHDNVEKIKREECSLKQELQEILRKTEQKQREIQALKREAHNSLTVFGAWVPRVSQRIDAAFRQGKFGKMPRGPIGAYIKLKDVSWAPALESLLGAYLRSYCVDSAHDAQVLTQIFNEVLGKEKNPTIITSKFLDKVHSVTKFAVQADGYSNILNSSIISDTVVCNCLIDQLEFETILLIPTSREACEIMSDVRRVPMNCKRAITKKGDQFYPDPNYRMYAGDGNIRAKYLQVSMQDAISTAEEDLKGYHFQKGEVEKQLTLVKEQLRTNYTELNAAGATVKKLQDEALSMKLKLTQLKDMEEPESNSIGTLAAELEECKKKYADLCKEHGALEAECQLLKDQMDEADAKSSKIRDTAEVIQTEESPLVAKRESLQSDLQEVLSKKKFQAERCNELHQKIVQMQTQFNKQQDDAKKAAEDAMKICPRIDTERAPQAVERELNECKRYMESVQENTGKLEDICVAYHEKKRKYEEVVEDVKHLEKGLTYLENMLTTRKGIYYTVQRLTDCRMQHMFQSLLHERRYTGTVKINHQNQTLEVRVCPSQKQDSAVDTISLSGGERSYSTVSFIMAIWNAVDVPFYFLDEFDVFMDKVNRRAIMDSLLAHARQERNSQFVFLTPQDTSTIESDEDVTIHRLQDPRRSNKHSEEQG